MDFKIYQICYQAMYGLIVSMLLISTPGFTKDAYGDRQSDLESEFDIVDTFDGLKNWRGATGVHYDSGTMPKKENDGASIWSYYSCDNNASIKDDWIKDHGDGYRLGSAGKSLCVNYNNRVGGSSFGNTGYGPSRIGTYFGSGNSTDGYQKIHIFFMVKFRPGFFNMQAGTNIADVGVVEFIGVFTGFSSIETWGDPPERDSACSHTSRSLKDYGMQGTMIHLYGGTRYSNTLFLRQSSWRAMDRVVCYDNLEFDSRINLTEAGFRATFESLYLNNKWIGIELIVDIGTPNNSNASTEVYLYDIKGTEIGHFKRNGYNQLFFFDHKMNKITIGGNRYGAVDNQQDEGDSLENRFYVDDFIVHQSRIGPTYFNIVRGLSAPVNLRTVHTK